MNGLAAFLLVAVIGDAAEPILPPVPVLPPITIADAAVFPPWEVCKCRLAQANEHLAWCQAMATFSPRFSRENWRYLEDVRERQEIWYSLCCATNPAWEMSWRLDRLDRLRHALGLDYYTGRLPAPVPWFAHQR